jgi:hypothetical protein
MPGPPPPPKPVVVDELELVLLTEDGEPLDEVAPGAMFRGIFRFHVVSAPEGGLQEVCMQVIAYVNGVPTTSWNSNGDLIPEGNDVYRYEGELRSPPRSTTRRQYFVAVNFGDGKIVLEQPLEIR